jgi:hypothetical protein
MISQSSPLSAIKNLNLFMNVSTDLQASSIKSLQPSLLLFLSMLDLFLSIGLFINVPLNLKSAGA